MDHNGIDVHKRDSCLRLQRGCGVREVSAFNRAFKRWTGATPSEYRRQLAR